MRIIFSRRTWLRAGVLCLPCLLMSGCKSTGPGLGWLSWTKPKSLSTSLSSNTPTKPSANSLPPPSASMGSVIGSGTNLAGQTAGQSSGFGVPAGPGPSAGYNTGPYAMAGQSAQAPAAGAVPSYAGTGYGGASAATQNPGAVYNAFPPQYQSATTPAGNAYRTADARNAPAGTGAPSAYGGSTAAGTHNWNNEQWGRNEPRSASQPAGYTEGIPASNAPAAADAWTQQTPAAANAPPAGFGDRFGGGAATSSVPAAGNSANPRATGGYRPGSTGRSGGTLPSANTSGTSAPANSSYAPPPGAYPMSNYPTSSYPAVEAPAARTANSTGYAGGYAYPSTTQSR